jgi:hypothetical protein
VEHTLQPAEAALAGRTQPHTQQKKEDAPPLRTRTRAGCATVGAPRASFAATSRLTVSCGSFGKAVPIDANTRTKNANKRMNNAK